MKVLLDNCVDRRTTRLLPGHEVSHAAELGWENLGNGKLLATAQAGGFEVMTTVDKNIRHQQNLDRLPLAVLEINSPDSRLPEITRLAPSIQRALDACRHSRFVSVNRDGDVEVLPAGGPQRDVPGTRQHEREESLRLEPPARDKERGPDRER